MRCWRCGKEINDHTTECLYCHAYQKRRVPVTDVGKALRQLYDHYGAEMVFSNPVLLANGLGDVITETLALNIKKLKNILKMAMDTGIGRYYLEQLAIGKPDDSFERRITLLLTEDAALSEKAAIELIGYFDEMIGWNYDRNTSKRNKANQSADANKNFSLINSENGIENGCATFKYEKKELTVVRTLKFGRYPQKNSYQADEIEWQVLSVEKGRALLLSKYALEARKYHPQTHIHRFSFKKNTTWETSELREWLNEAFYKIAFSREEKSKILEEEICNPKNPKYQVYGGNNTRDKIFLLSLDEVNKYLPTIESRKCEETFFAKQHGTGFSSSWWLRSPGETPNHAACVNMGVVIEQGWSTSDILEVRPALWISSLYLLM